MPQQMPDHERVLALLRSNGGTISSRSKLVKELRDSHDIDRATAEAAVEYVMAAGWARAREDNPTIIDLVNDPTHPA